MTNKLIWFACLFLILNTACDKEDDPVASVDSPLIDKFTPGENVDKEVKDFYDKYGFWVQTECNSLQELANAIISEDAFISARGSYENLEPALRSQVYTYLNTLTLNVSTEFVKQYFPLEFFFMKSLRSYMDLYVQSIGRSRLIITWPNQKEGCIPVTDPEMHYYQDSVLTHTVWGNLVDMITARMENDLIPEFIASGKLYEKDAAYKIDQEYWKDNDEEKWQRAMDSLAAGGFISGYGSADFRSDFAEWIQLVVTESYENIKRDYLDNNAFRAKKYEIFIQWMKDNYNWDIQAAGNKYRAEYDAYKATLPPPVDEEEEE